MAEQQENIEWWYAVPSDFTEKHVENAEHAYTARFGVTPPCPRIMYRGEQAIFAYALPQAHAPVIEPQPEIIPDPIPTDVQLPLFGGA